MAEICKRYDAEFRAGAVRTVRETGKPGPPAPESPGTC
ncbi:hypothetical protein FHS36_006650 [Streptomyces eurocidicus]|uniref:Transposase n=1 Tax=Streptomyces eurocidicus TaxID=66423 RepID=A0A7W8BGT2_STREU|nr:hypothetical protein [Streptomyces eurocidicus]